MKTRNTLILLVLAIGLFAFIRFYESKLPTTREAADRESLVVRFDREKITGITITNNEDKIDLRKRDNEWFVDSPVKDRADSTAVTTLLTDLETLRKDAVVGEENGKKPDLKEYGLARSNLRVKLEGPGAPAEILFGKDAAVEGKLYIRLDESDTAFVVNNTLKSAVTKKADDFRDRRLTNVSAAEINRISIKNPAGEIELEKKGDRWLLKKPLAARADDSKVRDFIAQALTTRIDSFIAGENPAGSGLNDPRGTLTFHAEGSDKPVVLQIGQAPEGDKEKVYARLPNRESVYLLPKKIEELVNVKPNDVRDKHLVQVNFDTVDRIHIEPAGKPKVILARKQEEWTIKSAGDRPANSPEIRRFAVDLEKAEATSFAADVASDLAKFGLDQPQLKLTFAAFAYENTAESKAGENEIATVLFGRIEGDLVYAKLDDEPFVVAVNRAILDRTFTEAAQWQDVAIFKVKPDDIVTLDVTKGTQPGTSLKRTGKTWQAVKGSAAVNEVNIQSLLNTVSALHAARWAGTADQSGGEKADLTVAFTTRDGKSHKTSVGAPTPDGMWLATAEGVEGIFVLPRTEVDALQLPLVDKEKSEPVSSPETTGTSTPTEPSPAPVQ